MQHHRTGSDRDEWGCRSQPSSALVLVVDIMEWEECYLKEWLDYHLGLTEYVTVYFLPKFTEHKKDVLEKRFAQEFIVNDTRVHALCNVSGYPGRCNAPSAMHYKSRASEALLMQQHLLRRHKCAWFMVMDLDEFLTVSMPGRNLSGVLQTFSHLGANKVNVNWLVHGANGRTQTPAGFRVLGMYQRFLTPRCEWNHVYKPMYRARAELVAYFEHHDYFSVASWEPHEFGANGINATWCRRNHQCVFIPRTPLQKRCSLCPSRHTARTMGRGKKPLLVLRHYMTKSFEEYSRKMAFYQSSYKVVEESTRYAKDKWLKIFSMMNGTNYFRLKSHCVEEPTNWTNYNPVVEAHLAELFAKEARSRSNTGCRGSRSASSNHGTALGNWWPV